MSQLVVASTNPALGCSLRAHVAHDLRNLLATVGLHLETLQRLSGPSGAKAADAAHALLTRGATLCNNALDRTAGADGRARRRGVDLIGVIHPCGVSNRRSHKLNTTASDRMELYPSSCAPTRLSNELQDPIWWCYRSGN